jgi:hypothetical protein
MISGDDVGRILKTIQQAVRLLVVMNIRDPAAPPVA